MNTPQPPPHKTRKSSGKRAKGAHAKCESYGTWLICDSYINTQQRERTNGNEQKEKWMNGTERWIYKRTDRSWNNNDDKGSRRCLLITRVLDNNNNTLSLLLCVVVFSQRANNNNNCQRLPLPPDKAKFLDCLWLFVIDCEFILVTSASGVEVTKEPSSNVVTTQ